jgi:hypothetical protein
MKIYNILKKLDEQKKYYESRGMLVEAATVEETKNHLTNYINTQVVSKKEVAQAWEGGGTNISDFIEKIITLLSQVAALPKEEIEQTYNVQNLKTIYYLIHNSNLEMNRIIDGMKGSSIGELAKYGKSGRRSTNDLLQNMDLYSELKSILLYENGDWVKPLAEFYDNFEARSIKIDSLVGDAKRIDNLFEIFESTGLPMDCIKRLAATTGSQTPNRGRFETLFALLCKGGKFKIKAKDSYKADGSAMTDLESGDIIIANKGIELKVNAGSGGGRVGGQKGYNSVEAIKKAYQSQMKKFANYAMKNFGKQIPEDNIQLSQEFAELVAPFTDGKIELSLDLTKESSAPTIDSVIQKICQAIISVVGQPDPKSEIALKKEVGAFYKSIWCNSTVNDKVNGRIAKLIDNYLINRSITDIVNEGRVLAESDYIGFTQQACAALFAYYAELEPFDYIFIVNTDKDLKNAKMLTLSNAMVKKLGSASPEEIAATGLYFKELGQMYGAPARKVRPSIDINF